MMNNYIIKRLEEMDNDTERWRFIINNADMFTVHLDHDDTYVKLSGDEFENTGWVGLSWIGNSDGIFHLCEAIGLDARYV